MFLGPKACGILTPQGGIELSTPALGSKVLTNGMLERSPSFIFIGESYFITQIYPNLFICSSLGGHLGLLPVFDGYE